MFIHIWNFLNIHFDPVSFLLVKDVVRNLYSKILLSALFMTKYTHTPQIPYVSTVGIRSLHGTWYNSAIRNEVVEKTLSDVI